MTGVASAGAAPEPAAAGAGAGAAGAGAGAPAWRLPVDVALRVCGGLLAVVGALASAVLELQLAPLRVGGVPVGVSVLLAVAVNAALPWFTAVTTGLRRLALLPAMLWFVVMLAAGIRRSEGDFLLVGDWVGILTLALGSVAFGIAGYWLVLRPPGAAAGPRQVGSAPPGRAPEPRPAGSVPPARAPEPRPDSAAGGGGPAPETAK